jgi:hypothetical protein
MALWCWCVQDSVVTQRRGLKEEDAESRGRGDQRMRFPG